MVVGFQDVGVSIVQYRHLYTFLSERQQMLSVCVCVRVCMSMQSRGWASLAGSVECKLATAALQLSLSQTLPPPEIQHPAACLPPPTSLSIFTSKQGASVPVKLHA